VLSIFTRQIGHSCDKAPAHSTHATLCPQGTFTSPLGLSMHIIHKLSADAGGGAAAGVEEADEGDDVGADDEDDDADGDGDGAGDAAPGTPF